MPSVKSKRSKLAQKGGGLTLALTTIKRSNSSHELHNFAHELNLSFCFLIHYLSMTPTFHRTYLTKRRMLSTLISRFIPFSLKTNTSSTLEPTCWPSSDNLIKHKQNQSCNRPFSNISTLSSQILVHLSSLEILDKSFLKSYMLFMTEKNAHQFCLIGVVKSPRKKKPLRKRSWLLHFING